MCCSSTLVSTLLVEYLNSLQIIRQLENVAFAPARPLAGKF